MRNTNTVYVSRRRQNSATTRSYGRNSNMAMFQPSQKMGVVSRTLMFMGIVVVLGLIYLGNATRHTAFSSNIQDIEGKISDIEIKKNDLEVENARLTSLQSIENSEVAKNMKSPASVVYAE